MSKVKEPASPERPRTQVKSITFGLDVPIFEKKMAYSGGKMTNSLNIFLFCTLRAGSTDASLQ